MYQSQVKVIAIYLYKYVNERDGVLSFLMFTLYLGAL